MREMVGVERMEKNLLTVLGLLVLVLVMVVSFTLFSNPFPPSGKAISISPSRAQVWLCDVWNAHIT